MANEDNQNSEDKKVKIKTKTLLSYVVSGGKRNLSITILNKEGKLKKIFKKDKEALEELKKFVKSL